MKSISKFSPLVIFIDALDEADERQAIEIVADFNDLMAGLKKEPDTALRICFACRHYPQIDLGEGSTLSVEDFNGGDIALVTRAKTAALSVLAEAQQKELRYEIVTRSNGVFQWASLVVDEAKLSKFRGTSFRAIIQNIQQVPADLFHLHEPLLQNERGRTQTLKLFQWILFSKEPLSLPQLQHMLSLAQRMVETSIELYTRSGNFIETNDLQRAITSLSKGLVEVGDSSTVDFVHQSVTDYLLSGELLALEGLEHGSSAQRAHIQISRSCLKYLAMEEVDTFLAANDEYTAEQLITIFPLVEYTWKWFSVHLVEAQGRGVTEMDGHDHRDLIQLLDFPQESQFFTTLYERRQVLGSVYRSTGSGFTDEVTHYTSYRRNSVYEVQLALEDAWSWPHEGTTLAHVLVMLDLQPLLWQLLSVSHLSVNAVDRQ